LRRARYAWPLDPRHPSPGCGVEGFAHGRASSAWSAFKARKATIPFGLFLSLGGLIVLFGPPLGVS